MKGIKSYTSIWNVEKVIYGIEDFTLPVPMTISQICWLVGTFMIVVMCRDMPPLCYTDNFLLKYLVIPGGITWFMSKKTFDGKKPYRFIKSVFAYMMRPKLTYAGRAVKYEKQKLDENITIVRCYEYVPDQVH